MRFFLISKTEANWNEFLLSIKAITGRSPAADLDARGVDIGTSKSLLALLGKDHVFYSLGITLLPETCLYLLQERHRLKFKLQDTISRNHKLAIVSGSLADWQEAIMNFMECGDTDTMMLGKELFDWFNVDQDLWALFKKDTKLIK